jgi:hypothetical protein
MWYRSDNFQETSRTAIFNIYVRQRTTSWNFSRCRKSAHEAKQTITATLDSRYQSRKTEDRIMDPYRDSELISDNSFHGIMQIPSRSINDWSVFDSRHHPQNFTPSNHKGRELRTAPNASSSRQEYFQTSRQKLKWSTSKRYEKGSTKRVFFKGTRNTLRTQNSDEDV